MKRVIPLIQKHYSLFNLMLLLFATALIIILLFVFSEYIHNNQQYQGSDRLREIAEQNAGFVKNSIYSYTDYISSLATMLERFDDYSSAEARQFLTDMSKGTPFNRITIDLPEGRSFTSDGYDVVLANNYVAKMEPGSVYISDIMTSAVENSPIISIVVPVVKDDKTVAAARGSFSPDKLGQLLSVNIFNGQGYLHIVNSSLDFIALSGNPNSQLDGRTLAEALDLMEFDGGNDKETLISDFREGRSGITSYTLGGYSRYGYYMPIGINDWMLFILTPKEVIDKNAENIQVYVGLLITGIVLVLVVLFLFSFSLLRRSRDDIARVNAELLLGEERYRFMIERSENIIFEVTLKTGEITFSDKYEQVFGYKPITSGLPQSVIDGGYIHPDDVERFLKLFDAIGDGFSGVNDEIRIIKGDGVYIWCLITGVAIFDRDKKPVKAIGVIENINDRKELEVMYHEALVYKNALYGSNAIVSEINLSQNLLINGDLSLYSKIPLKHGTVFSSIVEAVADAYLLDSNYDDYIEKNMPSNLIGNYMSGLQEVEYEFCMRDIDNSIIWICQRYKFYKDPKTNDIMAISSAMPITVQKQKELELLEKAQRDQLTGLYNKITTENLIRDALNVHVADTFHALFIIDIDNFKTVNDKLGHLHGDIILTRLADALRPIFRANDIIGRVGGDEFFVFLRGFNQPEIVSAKANEICRAFRLSYAHDDQTCSVSASVGIALYPTHAHDFTTLYKYADAALYVTKQKGKDGFTIYDGSAFTGYTGTRTEIYTRGNLPQKNFRDNRLEYIFKLLYGSANPKASIETSLKLIAEHFGFTTSYIFEYRENSDTLVNTFVWRDPHTETFMTDYEHIKIGDFKDVYDALIANNIFVLRRPDDISATEWEVLQETNVKYMLLFAVKESDKLKGFIGFDDNLHDYALTDENLDDLTTICNLISTFIIKQRTLETAQTNYHSMLTILNTLDSFAFVVDRVSHEVLFANQQIKSLKNSSFVGKRCYEALNQADSPCADCPLPRLSPDNPTYTTESLFAKFGFPAKTTASLIDWPDGFNACLVNSVDISKYVC